MITAAALVAQPPLLLRELGGTQDPVAELRAATAETVTALVADATSVVVVGPADPGPWDAGGDVDVRRFGTTGPRPRGRGLPLSLGVGSRLLHEASWTGPVERVGVAPDAGGDTLGELARDLASRSGRTAVLLLGEGSARRGAKAPGYLDERAFAFDDAVALALETGDGPALAGLDVGLADELMVLGAPILRLLGALAAVLPRPVQPRLGYRDDPFGVTYLVATWRFGSP